MEPGVNKRLQSGGVMATGFPGRLVWRVVAATIVAWSGHTLAHHSFSAEFDVGRPVHITGTVVQIEWTNPHAWVHIETVDDAGNRERWAVELLGVNALVRSGMSPATVKAGDRLTVTGYGARDGTNTANASTVARADTGENLWTSRREPE
jgi:hypothetical protein